MPQIYDRIIETISKPSNQRTQLEISKFLPWFRKKSKLFKKLKNEVLQDILQNCDFVSKKVDEIIILQGDQGQCFYIILRGKVTIYNLSKEDEQITPLSEVDLKNDKQELDRSKLGNFVCNLVPGDPFGEVALLSTDSIRTATVIADELTDLMVVEKSLYERSVKDVLTWEFQQKIAFICANPLFRGWSHKYRHQLAMAVYKIVLSYDEILIRQGEPVTCMYFVLTGQARILYNSRLHRLKYPQFLASVEANLETPEIPSIHQQETSSNFKNISKLKWQKQAPKIIHLCNLGINEIIGDIELLLKLDTNLHTVISTERTELIVLEIKHFERLFVRHHFETVDCMRNQLEAKLSSRLSILANCQQKIPLLTCLHNRLKQSLEFPQKYKSHQEFRNTILYPKLDISQLQTKYLLNGRSKRSQNISPNIFFLTRQKKFHKKTKSKVQKSLFPQIYVNDKSTEQSSRDVFQSSQPSNNDSTENYYSNSFTSLQELERCVRNWLKEDNPKKIGALPPLHRISLETLQKRSKPGYKMLVQQKIQLDVESDDEDESDDDDGININNEKLKKWKFLLVNLNN